MFVAVLTVAVLIIETADVIVVGKLIVSAEAEIGFYLHMQLTRAILIVQVLFLVRNNY